MNAPVDFVVMMVTSKRRAEYSKRFCVTSFHLDMGMHVYCALNLSSLIQQSLGLAARTLFDSLDTFSPPLHWPDYSGWDHEAATGIK
jgi:hypothetical protein